MLTKAPIFGSQSSNACRQRSRKARGVSVPAANCACAARNGRNSGSDSTSVASMLMGCSCRNTCSWVALVVIVDLEQHAAAVGLERPVMHARRPARVGGRLEAFAALAARVIADDEIARQEVHFLPMVVHERRRG